MRTVAGSLDGRRLGCPMRRRQPCDVAAQHRERGVGAAVVPEIADRDRRVGNEIERIADLLDIRCRFRRDRLEPRHIGIALATTRNHGGRTGTQCVQLAFDILAEPVDRGLGGARQLQHHRAHRRGLDGIDGIQQLSACRGGRQRLVGNLGQPSLGLGCAQPDRRGDRDAGRDARCRGDEDLRPERRSWKERTPINGCTRRPGRCSRRASRRSSPSAGSCR